MFKIIQRAFDYLIKREIKKQGDHRMGYPLERAKVVTTITNYNLENHFEYNYTYIKLFRDLDII